MRQGQPYPARLAKYVAPAQANYSDNSADDERLGDSEDSAGPAWAGGDINLGGTYGVRHYFGGHVAAQAPKQKANRLRG